jgi:hypothetical protein
MQQAFPVTPGLQTLLNARPNVTLNLAGNPFNGQTVCEVRAIDSTPVSQGTLSVPASGSTPAYTVQMDPNTGETFKTCGANSAGACRIQLPYLPARGTLNETTTCEVTASLKGEMWSDWTWDGYFTAGKSST